MGITLFLIILAIATTPFYLLLDWLIPASNIGFFTLLPPVFGTIVAYVSAWSLYWFGLTAVCVIYILIVGIYRNGNIAISILRSDTREALKEFHGCSESRTDLTILLAFAAVFPVLALSMSGSFFLMFTINNFPYHRGVPYSSWPQIEC